MMRVPVLIACVALFGVSACKASTSTQMSNTFRNPGFEETVFERIFVLGIAPTQELRIAFENAFVAAIERQGGAAQASWTVLPQNTLLPDDAIHAAVTDGGFDGVLEARVLSVDHDTAFVPPKRYTQPRTRGFQAGPAWGMGFGGYTGVYLTTFTEVHRPGYLETSKTVRIETNLFSAAANDLVWTGQSTTAEPQSLSKLLTSASDAVAQTLGREGLIP